MISRIEALNFRCLRYVSQPVLAFQALVGPNASGKTTFLDVATFLGNLVSHGVDAAIEERTMNFREMLWQQKGEGFELAMEALIPRDLRSQLPDQLQTFEKIRYEIRIGSDDDRAPVGIQEENLLFLPTKKAMLPRQMELFPMPLTPPSSLFVPRTGSAPRPVTIIRKIPHGNDNFYAETYKERAKGWVPSYKLGPKKSALGNMPAEEEKFPVSTWFCNLLKDGVQTVMLNSMALRKPSPPNVGKSFKTDGSNLPWVIHDLKSNNPDLFRQWIQHIQTALTEIVDIDTYIRQEDRHCCLVIHYKDKLKVPSWFASDGTLRLLALTLPAYLGEFKGVYLIEEPENGIHPRAMETVMESLKSIYDAQIFVATHSPLILNLVSPQQVLCLAKNGEGATDIVTGDQHPALRDQQGHFVLGDQFAGGVLG